MIGIGTEKRTSTALFILALCVLFALESVAVHHWYSTRFPGAGDFYVSWAGARALLLEGHDPYGQDVTAEIQKAKGMAPSPQEKRKGGFAYPLHVMFVFLPLAYLPYPWVQAIWMVTLQWVTMATVVVLLRLESWSPSPLGLASLFLGTLFLYPVARSIMLGQFTLHVTLFLAMTLLAIRRRNDTWAGATLALASIKPQMMVLVAPWIVLWAVSQRRWRLLWGLFLTGGLLALGSLALFPRWPISFAETLIRGGVVVEGRNPMAVLAASIWPDRSGIVRYGLSTALVAVMLNAWRRGWGHGYDDFLRATHWTIIVSLLVPFQTGTTNQAMLLIPLFAALEAALRRRHPWLVISGVGILESALWSLFALTLSGNWENPLLFLPLPLLGLGLLTGAELSNLWRSQLDGRPASTTRSDG